MQNNINQFKHLNQEERVEIYALVQRGLSYRQIWLAIWVAHTTISREVKRNSYVNWHGRWTYKPIQAEIKRLERRYKANSGRIKLRRDYRLYKKIHSIISDKTKDRSPDEILWRLRLEWWKTVSTSTLYSFIHNYTDWWKYLRYKRFKYKKKEVRDKYKVMIKWVPKIDERPQEANNRERIWDWEIDTVVSKRGIKWWLFTAVDRKARHTLIAKVVNLKSTTLLHTMLDTFEWEKVHTITSDNWSEFARLKVLQDKLKIACYTAHAYASYERWTNERTNWLIRRYIPKWADISSYSDQYIKEIQDKLNFKPRKCLWYRTPHEVYHDIKLHLIT